MKYIIDFVALFLIYAVFLYKNWKKKGMAMLVIYTLMYIYLSLVVFVTLMPVITSLPHVFNHSVEEFKVAPFEDIIMEKGDALRQIALNVIMTVPFGFLLPILKNKKWYMYIVYTFLLSLSIEVIQPIISATRTADVTDLITNTIGGLLGFLIYLAIRPVINKILNLLRIQKNNN